MKSIILDMKAATLYLMYYQGTESDLAFNDTDEPVGLRYSDLITKIVELGYPDPTTIPYDDDGCPSITWESDKPENYIDPDHITLFSCIAFYEAIDYDPKYFNI